MRMGKGKPFMDVEAEFAPDGWEHGRNPPTFSEAFLYATVEKGDARFILGVADEYEHIIAALGPQAVCRLLETRWRLVQRLGVGEKVSELLEDAIDEHELVREQRHPVQVILDDDAAHDVWQTLHDEYCRFFDPEQSMSRDSLRAYNTLTDGLGEWEQAARQKERDRLPEKLAQQEERKATKALELAQRKEYKARIQRALEEAPSADQAAAYVERALRIDLA